MKNMKRLIAVIAAVLVLCCAFCGCAKKAEPAKTDAVNVTVEVKIGEDDKTFAFETEAANVADLLIENADELELVYEDGQYGMFITGMCGTEADSTCEYFAIYVNGETAMTGASEIEVAEGDAYLFELTGF